MFHPLCDLLFPPRSLQGKSGAFITKQELAALTFKTEHLSSAFLQSEGFSALESVVAAMSYRSTPLLKRAVVRFKYQFSQEMGEVLGGGLSKAAGHFASLVNPVLCPVPLHWQREYWRGFNQAEVLARFVSAEHGWPVQHLLKRTRHTGQQMKRNREQRCHALRDAFSAEQHLPHTVILVDDVFTTGATLETCAAQLKAYGVLHTHGLVVARG